MVAENSRVRRLGRGRVEDLLEFLAKAHVEHLVGLVEHGDAQRREVERAALEMIAQAAGRADDDMGAALRARGAPSIGSMPPTQVATRAPALA